MITYTLKSKYLITKDEYNQLDYLRLKGGLFWKELNNKFSMGMIFLAKDNEQIIGWGLVFNRDFEIVLFLFQIQNKK